MIAYNLFERWYWVIGRLKRLLITSLRITTEKGCFEFLQIAIGNSKSLSTSISDVDWYGFLTFVRDRHWWK